MSNPKQVLRGANAVRDALRSIADGGHPERVLEGATESTVRAVGMAMGRSFRRSTSLVAMVERIGEIAYSDRIAAARRAVCDTP